MIIKPKPLPPTGKPYPVRPHEGTLIETVVIKYPDTIFWLGEQTPNPGFQWLYTYIEKRVATLDAKPFVNATCAGRVSGQACTRQVNRYSLYRGQSEPVFWCATCDAYQLGANASKVEVHSTYYDGLFFLDRNSATRAQKRNFVHRLAEAKGLTGKITDAKALAFFYPAAEQS